jgi:hypothetical protein
LIGKFQKEWGIKDAYIKLKI